MIKTNGLHLTYTDIYTYHKYVCTYIEAQGLSVTSRRTYFYDVQIQMTQNSSLYMLRLEQNFRECNFHPPFEHSPRARICWSLALHMWWEFRMSDLGCDKIWAFHLIAGYSEILSTVRLVLLTLHWFRAVYGAAISCFKAFDTMVLNKIATGPENIPFIMLGQGLNTLWPCKVRWPGHLEDISPHAGDNKNDNRICRAPTKTWRCGLSVFLSPAWPGINAETLRLAGHWASLRSLRQRRRKCLVFPKPRMAERLLHASQGIWWPWLLPGFCETLAKGYLYMTL